LSFVEETLKSEIETARRFMTALAVPELRCLDFFISPKLAYCSKCKRYVEALNRCVVKLFMKALLVESLKLAGEKRKEVEKNEVQ